MVTPQAIVARLTQPELPVSTAPPTALFQTPVLQAQPVASPTAIPTRFRPAAVLLRGAEISQGIQVFNEPEHPRCQADINDPDHIFCNNAIPLVAGRHTIVRLYPACNGSCPAVDSLVRLRLLKSGQEEFNQTLTLPAGMLQRINNLPMPELRRSLENSLNFELFPPPASLIGQVTFEFTVLPQGADVETTATMAVMEEFVARKPLRIAYLPIQYQGISPPAPPDIDYWLLRMYPVPEVEYYRLPVPDLTWEGELNKGELLRRLLYTYWLYTQHNPAEMWPDQLFGWLPQDFYNGGVSDPYWCPYCAGPHSSRVAFGGLRPEQDIGGPRILVHEIAHNLGAEHAWTPTQREDNYCFKAEGADIQVDPTWPYPQTPHIQEFGLDLYSTPPVIYSPSFYDMMAYCYLPWISPYTYRKMLDSPFLQPSDTGLPLANFKPQVEVQQNGSLLVSGVVYPNGTISKPEIIRMDGTALTNSAGAFAPPLDLNPPPGNDYCLELQDHNGATLYRRCFDAGFMDLETGLPSEASPFFITASGAGVLDTARVIMIRGHDPIVTLTPSHNPPRVLVSFPNGGEVLEGQQTVTWEADDIDGDPLSYDVLYSDDNGQSWAPLAVRLQQTHYTFYTHQIPASRNALIRVMATDGFHTSYDQSDSPFTIEVPPENSLSLVGPTSVSPGERFEVAIIANRLTEPGLFGLQFRLNFNPEQVHIDSLRLNPDLSLVVQQTIDNDAGQVVVAASRQGQVPNLTGDITLATLTLNAAPDTEGELYLGLDDVVAGARGGVRLNSLHPRGLSLRLIP